MVVKGQARIFTMSSLGNEITPYRLLERDVCVLSTACMIHFLTFTVSMESETGVMILLIPKQTLQIVSSQNRRVEDFMMELVADRFSSVMDTVYDVVFSDNGYRLTQALLIQMQLQEVASPQLTYDTLAHGLGTAREVVSRLLKQFQRGGLLQQSRDCITIPDERWLTYL